MKEFIRWFLAAIVTLVLPVVLWNVWFLDYINQHGKLWAWVLAPVFALASAAIIVGLSDVNKKVTQKGQINPFWGWAGVALVIEVVIVALSNT
jgi:hypothetical protein